MACVGCGRTNPADARFCGGCGAALSPRCGACGADAPADARFCVRCGTALPPARGAPVSAAPEPTVARKVVTVVFADLIGSVSLHERLDAESARRFMDRYHRAMKDAVEAEGGRVVQLLGDGVLAGFGVPRVAEDDALRAVRAAVGMQRAFRTHMGEHAALGGVGLRVAVNTGEIVVGDDENRVMGDPTNVAARLQQEARDGDVLLGEGTQRLVRDLVTLEPAGTFALRGRAGSVTAYRVVSLDRPASAPATPFVGREEELRRLLAVYEAAVAAPGARLAVLLGSPGLGKSRLVGELARRAGAHATVLSARCDAAGGATFAPLAEALRGLLRIEPGAGGDALRAAVDAVVPAPEAERARIAAGVGALFSGAASSPEEIFFAVRRLLAALGGVRPVVLVIDDLHWAEPLLLDLVEHLVQWSAGVPLLLVAAARPELREARSSLATPGALVADVVTLGGLDAGASMRLAAGVLGASELPAALVGRVLATSEGNPLFLAELVRMLVQEGVLRREGERWVTTVEVSKLDMPPTIGVLLAARIERLRPEERTVLERAAVIGRHFSRAAVAHLLPSGAAELGARLEALRRSELIEADSGWFLGEPALRFHHALIRDAAYRRLLKETRAELHERFAEWVLARAGDAAEHEETIGRHFEEAYQNLRELGPPGARARQLGERAARHLGAAGRRALARDDLALAASLLGRAIACLDPADAARAEHAIDACEALLAAGEVGPAGETIAELGRFAGASPRLAAWHTAFAGQLSALTDPQALRAVAGRVAEAAAALAAAGDAAGEAKAHAVHAGALARLGEVGACESALDAALAAARRARDRRRANAVLAGAPVAALWGPSPVTRASGRCLDVVRVLRITQGAPAVEAVALRCQAVLETLRGRSEAAHRMLASSRRMVEELGIAPQVLEADVFAGLVALLEGDSDTAERCLRSAYEGLRARGLGIDAARAAALLGRALLARDRAAEAEALSHESEALAGDDLKAAIAWRGVRAEALARRGEAAAAVELAQAAVRLAAATDALLDHAEARRALAQALRAAGREAEGEAEEARAVALWEAKGATALTARTARAPGAPAASGAEEGARHGALPPGRDGDGSAPGERAARRAPPAPPLRQVQPNRATEHARRFDAAIRARDPGALAALFADTLETVHHPTGASYGRDATIERFASAMASGERLVLAHEPLASLGEALALFRVRMAADGFTARALSVGAVEAELAVVIEADAAARATRVEIFAGDRLRDAISCMYRRRAETLPEGAERERARGIAAAVAAGLTPGTSPRAWMAPDVELRDRRRIGFGAVRGLDAVLRGSAGLHAVTADLEIRVHDVLDLRADAFLVSWTTAGTQRDGGGAFENHFLMLRAFGPGGLARHVEWFDADDAEAAQARFEAVAAPEAPPRSRRRLRPNLATEQAARLDAAVAARDPAAVRDLFEEGLVFDQRFYPVAQGRGELIAALGQLIDDWGVSFRHEPLASLGDALAVARVRIHAAARLDAAVPAGMSELVWHVLIEATPEARASRVEMFAEHRLADALLRLFERHAEREPAGRARDRAAAVARTLADRLGPLDGEARIEDVLGSAPGALLLRCRPLGTDRATPVEDAPAFLQLWTFGADGRLVHAERHEPDEELRALAAFDATELPAVAAPLVETAATRREAAKARAWAARDWDAFAALFPAGFRSIDRRPLLQLEVGAEAMQHGIRPFFDAGIERTSEVLATRGDTLALVRTRFSGETAAAGPSEVELVQVIDVAGDGGGVAFAPHDLEGAWRELDERYRTGEAAPHARVTAAMAVFSEALARRDWPALAAVCAPDLLVVDHRRLGWEPLRGSEAYVAALRELVALAPDTRMRLDHVETSARGFLVKTVWTGTREGGAFEEPSVVVGELDDAGRLARLDQWDVHDLGAARTRAAELASPRSGAPAEAAGAATHAPAAPGDPFAAWLRPNAAVAAHDRVVAAFHRRDWSAMRAAFAADARVEDRRRMLLTPALGADEAVAALARGVSEVVRDLHTERRLVATFGDRISLEEQWWRGAPDGAPFETETLSLTECDGEGRIVSIVTFDPDDREAAFREADERWIAQEPALAPVLRAGAAYVESQRRHDPVAMRAILADGYVLHDHRRTGAGRIEGADRVVADSRAGWVLSHWRRLEAVARLATAPWGVVTLRRHVGVSSDGGEFEVLFCTIMVVEEGRIARHELFEADDVPRALARFEALRAEREARATDPLRIPPNAAVRAGERLRELALAADWDGLRAHCAPGFRLEDRRRLLRVEGDRELLVDNTRQIPRAVWEGATRTLLATSGDRLALHRLDWQGGAARGGFEIESLEVTEVDAEGRLLASVIFDAGERRAAAREMMVRYGRGEGAAHMPASQIAFLEAMDRHDVDAMRAALDPDFTFVDHRRTGLGRVAGADEYIASVVALHEQSDDSATDVLYHLAIADHASMSVGRIFGTLKGGGEFESLLVRINRYEDGRNVGAEIFEVEDLGRAKARFEELGREYAARRRGSVQIPPNAATRAMERFDAAARARDWSGIEALVAPGFRFEDRRPGVRDSGGHEEMLRSVRAALGTGSVDVAAETLATAGDRLALQRLRFSGSRGPALLWEIEILQIAQVDAEGRLVATVSFEPGDRAAASWELMERWFRDGEHGWEWARRDGLAVLQAQREQDFDALRRLLPDGFYHLDARRTGAGRLDKETSLASWNALIGLSPDAAAEFLYHVAVAEHGALSVHRQFGTAAEGVEYEVLSARLNRIEDGGWIGTELYEIDQLERAKARFEELGRAYAARRQRRES